VWTKILLGIAIALAAGFLALRLWARRTSPAVATGLREGALPPCPESPNCVSSQAEDDAQGVEPIAYEGDADGAWERIQRVIREMPRSRIIQRTDMYLHAEFRTAIAGFVDDVELLLDEQAGVIHIRSASRAGYSDLGVNRRRVEAIRSRFDRQGRPGQSR
jgi:uncharacterized protein (DUF1499 family)